MNRYYLSISAFKINDIVILNSRNIKIIRLSKSLDYKNLELFKVIRAINNIVYELELLDGINIFLIFYS